MGVVNHQFLPSFTQTIGALWEMMRNGEITWNLWVSTYRSLGGLAIGSLLGIVLGLVMATSPGADRFFAPLVATTYSLPKSSLIPLFILWFGVGDLAAIFLIFVGCFFPLLLTAMSAVHNIPSVYIDVGRNFGLSTPQFIYRVLYPAVVPQLITGSRITMGIAWLVVVAAEMIAVNSGLGFLIIDARNAGNRYDLVMAGMVIIGLIGLLLDLGMRSLERVESFRWSYSGD